MKPDKRPRDFEYALISKHVYGKGETLPEFGHTFTTPYRTWTIATHISSPSGYFGAAYKCEETQQYVIAHRGTNSLTDMFENIKGVLCNEKWTDQKIASYYIVNAIVQKIKDVEKGYSLSFTGHSLGAFLAELSIWYTTTELNFPDVSAVTFESPGSLESMLISFMGNSSPISHISTFTLPDSASGSSPNSKLSKSRFHFPSNESLISKSEQLKSFSCWALDTASLTLKKTNSSTSLSSITSASSSSSPTYSNVTSKSTSSVTEFKSILKSLDIISYVCYPNFINVTNGHVGTIYAINAKIQGVYKSWPIFNLDCSHSMAGIVEWFHESEIKKNPNCLRFHMSDWPRNYLQSLIFFKYADYEDGTLTLNKDLINNRGKPPPKPRKVSKVPKVLKVPKPSKVSNLPSLQLKKKSMEAEDLLPQSSFEKWIERQKNSFELRFKGNFKVEHVSRALTSLPLRHFSNPLQEFIRHFTQKIKLLLENNANNSKSEQVAKAQLKTVLKELWKGFEMPELLVQEILEIWVEINSQDIEELHCRQSTTMHEFREELSTWLAKTGFDVDDLVNETIMFENIVSSPNPNVFK